ncbi:MAG: hypothetical protein ACRDRA_21020 [Pseudonocardiaceae bacterium]
MTTLATQHHLTVAGRSQNRWTPAPSSSAVLGIALLVLAVVG